MTLPTLTTIALSLADGIAEVRLNRPDKSNAMNDAMWQEIRQAFEWVDATPAARVAILSGEGKNFCAGIDLAMMGGIQQRIAHADGARSREALRRLILDLQDCLTSLERCRKPVIAAIQGACIGGALDLVTSCDMRYAAADAIFSVREIDLGMVADVGTLQRLPRLIGDGMARELAYTGRNFAADEARTAGPGQPRFCLPGGVDRSSARNRRDHRRQVATGHARPQGSHELQPRPQRRRRPQLRRHLERGAPAIGRSRREHAGHAREARAALRRLDYATHRSMRRHDETGRARRILRPAAGCRLEPGVEMHALHAVHGMVTEQ